MESGEVSGATFTLQTGVALDKSTCEDFVSQIAYSKGYAMTPLNRSLKVYEFINLRGQHRARVFTQATVMTPEQVAENANRYVAITTTLTFKHLDASRAAAQLRPFFAAAGGQGMPISFVGLNSKSMLMSGFAPQVARAMQLLAMADVPQPPPQQVQPGRRPGQRNRVSK